MDNRKETAEKIITALTNRSGFNDLWYNLDEDIQNEITDEIVNILPIPDVSVSFADYLISDFEMVSEGVEEELLWQLCGTKQRYTSDEIYNIFINER